MFWRALIHHNPCSKACALCLSSVAGHWIAAEWIEKGGVTPIAARHSSVVSYTQPNPSRSIILEDIQCQGVYSVIVVMYSCTLYIITMYTVRNKCTCLPICQCYAVLNTLNVAKCVLHVTNLLKQMIKTIHRPSCVKCTVHVHAAYCL